MAAEHDKTARKPEMPPLPRLESTYSVILQRAISAAKGRTGLTQRFRSATRELAALVPHTRQRFRGLSFAGKVAAVAIVLALGAGLGFGGAYLVRRSPARLRAAIQADLAAGDYVGAKDHLALLRQAGALTVDDRLTVVAAVEKGMAKVRRELQRRLDQHRAAGRFSEAIAVLDEMESAGFAGEWMLFTRAELLRLAGRKTDARLYYERYAELYPDTAHADDALFWEAESLREGGDGEGARRALEKLLADYPGSDFRSSARRVLAELK